MAGNTKEFSSLTQGSCLHWSVVTYLQQTSCKTNTKWDLTAES